MRLAFILLLIVTPFSASAVLPPDIIFSVGTQLWQIVAGVGALFLGFVTAIIPYIRDFSVRFPRLRVLLFTLGLSALFGGAFYLLFLLSTDSGTAPSGIPGTAYVNATTTGHEFYSDRFVFHAKDEGGEPLLIDLIINRKELSDGMFVHYYLVNAVFGEKSGKYTFQREALGHEVLEDLFFTKFERHDVEDHSARSAFLMEFSLFDKVWSVETNVVTADFIIKNKPEYTEYSGTDVSRITIDGAVRKANAYLEHVYSIDYRPTIFFPGHEALRSETLQLVLWDEEGNFYLVDESRVPAPIPEYVPHFWALFKDGEGYVRRAFSGETNIVRGGTPVRFTARIPELMGATLSVALERKYENESEKGLVVGTVTDQLSERHVSGQGYFNIYGTP